jgi:hypothetical protein
MSSVVLTCAPNRSLKARLGDPQFLESYEKRAWGDDERRGVSNITDNATATVLEMCGLFDGDGAGIPAREPHHLKRVSAVGGR